MLTVRFFELLVFFGGFFLLLLTVFADDVFRVTFFPTFFRLTADLPALDTFFLLVFFFFDVFFEANPFLEADFFLPDFFGARAAEGFRELRVVAFFESLFLEAAFFFGIR